MREPTIHAGGPGGPVFCGAKRQMKPGLAYRTILFPNGDYEAITCKNCQRRWKRLKMGS